MSKFGEKYLGIVMFVRKGGLLVCYDKVAPHLGITLWIRATPCGE